MSATKQLLTILQDKGPQSAEGLAAISGMDLARVRVILAHMRECGYLETIPTTFAVTPKGDERLAAQTSVASRKRQERKNARKAGITAEMAKEARQRDSLVAKSIRSRPALQQAWGVFA
jgi:hypothetical protein